MEEEKKGKRGRLKRRRRKKEGRGKREIKRRGTGKKRGEKGGVGNERKSEQERSRERKVGNRESVIEVGNMVKLSDNIPLQLVLSDRNKYHTQNISDLPVWKWPCPHQCQQVHEHHQIWLAWLEVAGSNPGEGDNLGSHLSLVGLLLKCAAH